MNNKFKISFNNFFKIIILFLVAYFLVLIMEIKNQMEKNIEIGRYQFSVDRHFIIDTKTGEVKRAN